MTSKNLVRRLERLEDHLLPVNDEPTVIRIVAVSPDGKRVDTGMEFTVPAGPRLAKTRWR
jgi:hypothetical protein